MPTSLLTVVIPTRDRRETVLENLSRLGRGKVDEQAGIEVVVVDDGSEDGTAGAVREAAARCPFEVRLVAGSGHGPAAARNLGIEAAQGAVCLFLDDDVLAAEGMVGRHVSFHDQHREKEDALLGRVVPAPGFDSELARWAHEDGALFAYAKLAPAKPVPPNCFWTAQVSVKSELVREVGGFDESLRFFEDVELARRLQSAGMRLSYDPDAVGEHAQAIDLPALMARARRVGAILQGAGGEGARDAGAKPAGDEASGEGRGADGLVCSASATQGGEARCVEISRGRGATRSALGQRGR